MTQTPTHITFDDLRKKELSGVYDMTLTPEQCRRIVRNTVVNQTNFRALVEDHRLRVLVDSMKRGYWVWTDADPLRLHVDDDTGEIVASDGQHRLMAAAEARRVLRSIVLWGKEFQAGVHVDRNKVRTIAQYLKHDHGLKNPAANVSAMRFHLARVLGYHDRLTAGYAASLIPDEPIIEQILKNQNELQWSLGKASTGGARGFNTIAYTTFMYEVLQISPEAASKFHDDMKDPGLDALDPLTQLRKAVSAKHADTGRHVHRDYTIANLVKAYNQREHGQTMTRWINAGSDEVWFPVGYKVPPKSIVVGDGKTDD